MSKPNGSKFVVISTVLSLILFSGLVFSGNFEFIQLTVLTLICAGVLSYE